MATTTDVRAWAKTVPELADDVTPRGPLPRRIVAAYEEAHGGENESEPEQPGDYEPGTSAADFTAAAPPPGSSAGAADPVPAAPAGGQAPPPGDASDDEQRPATGRGRATRARRGGGSAREAAARIWQRAGADSGDQAAAGKGSKAKRPRAGKGGRISLTSFVEDLYGDIAWLAGGSGMLPLERILQVQAPFAGVVIEDQVKDTFIDPLLQPVAKAQGAFAAINGLIGAPVFTAGICTLGGYQTVERPVVDTHGNAVVDPATGQQAVMVTQEFDARTKGMILGLRYCLMQMTKVSASTAEQIMDNAQERVNRGREVDKLLAWILDLEPPGEDAPASTEEEATERARAMMQGVKGK